MTRGYIAKVILKREDVKQKASFEGTGEGNFDTYLTFLELIEPPMRKKASKIRNEVSLGARGMRPTTCNARWKKKSEKAESC
jgi:hypothetical protein